MIGIVDVEVQAANPQMPLFPFVAFVGSPSSVRVRNVPGNVGSWNITKVYVSANYPDNSIQSRECTRVGEIYVGTLPACNAVGKGANGFVVSADGVDESGNAVTGYVLGKGDLEILDADGAITPGVTTHYVHGLDEQPSDPHEYDIYKDGDTWKIYFGGAWEPFAAPVTFDDAVTRTSANGVKSSGIWSAIWGALAALPTGFSSLYDWCVSQLAGKMSSTATGADIAVSGTDSTKIDAALAGKASIADATLTDAATWAYNPATDSNGQAYHVEWQDRGWAIAWFLYAGDGQAPVSSSYSTDASATRIEFTVSSGSVVATRAALQGYQLGSQTDKPLASEAEAEAIRTALAGKLDKSDVVAPSINDPDIGKAADAKATGDALAGKLDKSGGEMTPTFSAPMILSGKVVFGADAEGPYIGMAYGQNTTMLRPGAININDRNAALKGDIPYSLGTPTVINTASSEVVEGETVYYGAATLANRTANIVQVTTQLDELRITFPAATSGKVRDFGLRVEVGNDSAVFAELAAPALVPIAPTGETIKIENADGTIPELADGTATAKGVTLLYFSETAPGVFVVKGEQVEEVA